MKHFQIELRKILILGGLRSASCKHASQNIVKEGLTRKIFQNKDLARPWSRVPSPEIRGQGAEASDYKLATMFRPFCDAMRTMRLCAFGGCGWQGRTSQWSGFICGKLPSGMKSLGAATFGKIANV